MKEGWKIQTLGDVATFINGDRSTNYPSKKDYVIDGIPFVNAGNLIQSGLDLESLNLISQSKYDSLTQGKFVEGDILFCLRGTLGKHSIVQNGLNGAIASSLVIIRTKDGFNNKYISYFLDYKQPFIERLNNGAAQPNIPAKTMKGFPILLPPNEKQQQSIVEYLDSAFAQIDELKSNAERQLAEARALFQSALTQAMQPKPGWQEKTLGEIATDMYRGSGIRRDQITKEGIPCVRYGEIYTTYNISFEDCVSHTLESSIASPKYFEHGDLLFAITGESVEDIGKTIAYMGKEKCLLGGDIICMKHNQNPKFLSYALSTTDAIKQKGFGKTKLKVVHTNAPSLKAIRIPLPPLSEQQGIVEQLDSISTNISSLEEINQKIKPECDALKQALLRQIFE